MIIEMILIDAGRFINFNFSADTKRETKDACGCVTGITYDVSFLDISDKDMFLRMFCNTFNLDVSEKSNIIFSMQLDADGKTYIVASYTMGGTMTYSYKWQVVPTENEHNRDRERHTLADFGYTI